MSRESRPFRFEGVMLWLYVICTSLFSGHVRVHFVKLALVLSAWRINILPEKLATIQGAQAIWP